MQLADILSDVSFLASIRYKGNNLDWLYFQWYVLEYFVFVWEPTIFGLGLFFLLFHQFVSAIITYVNPPDSIKTNIKTIAIAQLLNLRIVYEVWVSSVNGTTT